MASPFMDLLIEAFETDPASAPWPISQRHQGPPLLRQVAQQQLTAQTSSCGLGVQLVGPKSRCPQGLFRLGLKGGATPSISSLRPPCAPGPGPVHLQGRRAGALQAAISAAPSCLCCCLILRTLVTLGPAHLHARPVLYSAHPMGTPARWG